jgi:hypothetical protein
VSEGMIEATVIRDSINNHDNRLVAMKLVYRNFCHKQDKIPNICKVQYSDGFISYNVFYKFVNTAIGPIS